ncbi:MAG: NADH-quinone oxidoreductase subunit C [Candidatus Bathyarchaeia archaeon]
MPRTRQVFAEVNRDCFKDAFLFLKSEGFAHLSTITGLEVNNDAIELLYHLNDKGIMLAIHVKLPLDEISIHTITGVITGAPTL